MNFYKSSIMSFFDLINYLIITSKLMQNLTTPFEKKKTIKSTILMIMLSLIMGLIGISPYKKYSYIFGIIIANVLIYMIYKRSFKETIYTYLISTVIILIVQYLSLSILVFFDIEDILEFESGLLAQCIILPILILINRYTPLDYLFKYIEDKNRIFTVLILNMFIAVICFLIYRYIEMEGLLKDVLIIAMLSIGLIFVNLIIVKNGLKSEYEEKILATYKRYLPMIDDLMKEIRKKQHEFDNHIQALNMIFVTNTDYKSIANTVKKYIGDIAEDNKGITQLIKLDNKILSGFLYSKTIKAKNSGINFEINIKDYGFNTNLKDYELIEVLGNLIDNAFEAGVENNCVKLEIKAEKNMSVVEVKNKHSYLDNNTIIKMFTPGYSTKATKNHGYGLTNVKKIIDNNNGKINIYNETVDGENYIVFKVSFIRI